MFSLCKANFACQVRFQQLGQACVDALQGYVTSNRKMYRCPKFHIQYLEVGLNMFYYSALIFSLLSAWLNNNREVVSPCEDPRSKHVRKRRANPKPNRMTGQICGSLRILRFSQLYVRVSGSWPSRHPSAAPLGVTPLHTPTSFLQTV